MNHNTKKEILQPFAVLVGICLVVSVLLGYTNSVTAPIIEKNAQAAAQAVRASMLPDAAGFEEIQVDPALGVRSVYADVGGTGYVITAANKGYGGDVVVTVGLDPQGTVIGIDVDVSTETSGIGSKTGQEDYTSKYLGLSGSADEVDGITGATYSSNAVRSGVNAALDAYAAIAEEVQG